MPDATKKCSRCKTERPLDAFHKSRVNRDGLRGHCRPCATAVHADWVSRNRERVLEYRRKYRVRHREEIRARARAKYREKKAASTPIKYVLKFPGGEFYIGSTSDIARRIKGHRNAKAQGTDRHPNPGIRALIAAGLDWQTVVIMTTEYCTKAEARRAEARQLARLIDDPKCLNVYGGRDDDA